MGRLIDADALIERAELKEWALTKSLWINADVFRNAPTVDAVPVVRCKDCKHNDIDDWCPLFMAGFIREPNGYCSWGERREACSKD